MVEVRGNGLRGAKGIVIIKKNNSNNSGYHGTKKLCDNIEGGSAGLALTYKGNSQSDGRVEL
jgi:hypothetical protein